MTHADAFLQSVLDAPDDDAPRLLFADWLEEYGEPDRGEFIRAQVALRDCRPGGGPAGLWTRQNRLLTLHEDEWSAPARGVATDWIFRRGFIDEVSAEVRPFLVGADELFRRAPVRHVQLTWGHGAYLANTYVPLLADCPHLERLNGLNLSGNSLGNGGLQALLVAPGLTRLTSLHLKECQIGDRGVKVLADAPLLSQLTHLDLSDNDIGPGGVRALGRALDLLAAGDNPPHLRELRLDGNAFGDAGRRAVLASPVLRRVFHLPPPDRLNRAAPKR